MKRSLLFLLGVSIIISLVLSVGCSDDPTSPPVEGELDDERLLFVQQLVDSDPMAMAGITFEVANTHIRALSGYSMVDDKQIGMATALKAPLVSVVLTSVNNPAMTDEGWYPFVYEGFTEQYIVSDSEMYVDTIYFAGSDSLQFILNGQPIAYTGQGSFYDGMNTRNHMNWSDSAEVWGAIHQQLDIIIVADSTMFGFDQNMIFNDTSYTIVEEDSAACELRLITVGTATDILVKFNFFDPYLCAETGEIDMAYNISLDCTGNSVLDDLGITGNWTMAGTFDSLEVLTAVYDHNNTFWNVTEECGD